MQKKFKLWILLFLVPVIIIGLIGIISQPGNEVENLKNQISQKIQNDKKLLELASEDTFISDLRNLMHFDPHIQVQLQKYNCKLLVYYGDSLVYWSDHDISVDSCLGDIGNGYSVIQSRNGFYQVYKKAGYHNFLYIIPLSFSYAIRNPYLKNGLISGINTETEVYIQLNKAKGLAEIYDENEKYLFSFWYNQQGIKPASYNNITAILFFLLLFFYFEILVYRYSTIRDISSLIFTIVSWVFFARIIPIFFNLPDWPSSWKLFNSGYFATSELIPSIGDYFLNIYILIRITSIIQITRFSLEKYMAVCGLIIFSVSNIIGLSYLIHLLVYDSSISINLDEISESKGFTYIFLALLFTIYFFNSLFGGYSRWFLKQYNFYLYFYIVLLFSVLCIVLNLLILNDYYAIPVFIIPVISAFILKIRNLSRLGTNLLILSVYAILSGMYLFYLVNDREYKIAEVYAARIVSNTDYHTEKLLELTENKLKNDIYLINGNGLNSKINDYLVNRYFTGFLSNYTVYSGLNSDSDFVHTCSNYLKNVNSRRVGITNFYRYSMESGILGYYGCFPISKSDSIHIFIIGKNYTALRGYSDILSEISEADFKQKYKYSWAYYSKNSLVAEYGRYSFPAHLNRERFDNVIHENRTNYYFPIDSVSIIQISIDSGSRESMLSYCAFLLSTVFLLFLFFAFINLLIYYFISALLKYFGKGRAYNNFYTWQVYDSRITGLNFSLFFVRFLFTVVIIVLITLIITVVINRQNILQIYSSAQSEQLNDRIDEITLRIQNEMKLSGYFNYGNDPVANLMNIARNIQSDINIYDRTGLLIWTTQPRLTETGIISQKINSTVYNKLSIEGKPGIIMNEKIGNLTYLSAFKPVYFKNEIIGYINVPHFRQENELGYILSRNLSGLLIPYSYIFILLMTFSWIVLALIFSKLSKLKENIATINVLSPLSPLERDSSNEVSELIRQYNFMLRKLRVSLDELSKNQRDLAWREMAKQVAHEIKNPLTPMRLLIQQLTRLSKSDPHERDRQLERVSNLLIEQIDSLAHLATVFNQYAQTPERIPVHLNIGEEMIKLVSLFHGDENITIQIVNHSDALIFIDKSDFSRIITNIITNALQAIPSGRDGIVIIKFIEENNYVNVLISDNGNGIPDDIKGRIFEPNFSTKNSGMGLGLAMVYKLVERNDGKVAFTTSLNRGTTFIITFPVYSSE